MKRLAIPLLAALLLAGCPEKGGPQGGGGGGPASTGAVVPRAPRVGEVYVFTLLGGATRADEILAVGTATITISRAVGIGKSEQAETVEESLVGPSPSAAIKGDIKIKSVTKETVTISQKEFPCEIREIEVGKNTIKEWSSPHWPHVLKTQSGPFVTLQLSEIRPRKLPDAEPIPEEKK